MITMSLRENGKLKYVSYNGKIKETSRLSDIRINDDINFLTSPVSLFFIEKPTRSKKYIVRVSLSTPLGPIIFPAIGFIEKREVEEMLESFDNIIEDFLQNKLDSFDAYLLSLTRLTDIFSEPEIIFIEDIPLMSTSKENYGERMSVYLTDFAGFFRVEFNDTGLNKFEMTASEFKENLENDLREGKVANLVYLNNEGILLNNIVFAVNDEYVKLTGYVPHFDPISRASVFGAVYLEILVHRNEVTDIEKLKWIIDTLEKNNFEEFLTLSRHDNIIKTNDIMIMNFIDAIIRGNMRYVESDQKLTGIYRAPREITGFVNVLTNYNKKLDRKSLIKFSDYHLRMTNGNEKISIIKSLAERGEIKTIHDFILECKSF